MARPIDFWFEFASTYSYLSAARIGQLAPLAGVEVRYRPFLLGPIFAGQGWQDSPFNLYPAKGRYMWRDMERLCEGYGLPWKRPSEFPRNGLRAARVACAGQGEAWVAEFVASVYRANFAEDRDIGEASVIGELLGERGLSGEEWLTRSETPALKAQLRQQSDEAAKLGLFGAPSFRVGNELFWGNDRLGDALAWSRTGAS